MRFNKQSITFKVIVGYLLIAALAAIAVWFVYSQVQEYTSISENNLATNQKLYLVGDVATDLYQAESLSRKVITTGKSTDLVEYKAKIDTIRNTLEKLKQTYTETVLQGEINSINSLLTQKTENLEELLTLRAQEENQSYYSKVLAELQRVDQSFEDPDYDRRFAELEPHQRRVLIKLLEYSEREDTTPVSNQTVDSLVNSVKTVLVDFERADRRYRETLRTKENELMANEININSQLRNLLSTIEEEERSFSLEQVTDSQKSVKRISRTITILGAVSFLVILVSLFLVVRDVSQSQKYRIRLEEAKQYAEALLKSREQFMATVTHDLRSPLNTVIGYSSLLEKSDLNNSQRHYLGHLKKSSEYILRLVNDLLDLSKLEAGKMTVEELNFNPKNLIEDTVENSISPEKSQQLRVKTFVVAELDRPIVSDPFRIKQILTNLVTNAAKFTEEGFIEINATLENYRRQDIMLIKVKDTGIGISNEKRDQIFEEFSQENTSIERRFGGSGLGLAISRKLVELLGGHITLESEPGKGSEFTVEIPIRLAELPKPAPQETEMLPPSKTDHLKVLIVDDEPAQISLLSELIKSTSMTPYSSNNGEEALEIMKTQQFDLVLTDIQMPTMDGFKLLQEIKSKDRTKSIPVIALSGKTDVPPEEYIRKGFSRSLLKPYSPKELLHIIEETLEVRFQNKQTQQKNGRTASFNYSLEEVKLFAGGDEKALKVILSAFIQSSKNNLTSLREALDNNDKERMGAVAHKMLPMFRQLKAGETVRKLEKFEDLKCKNSKKELEDLAREIGKLIDDLANRFSL